LSKKANNENDVPLSLVDNNSVTEGTPSSSECWCNWHGNESLQSYNYFQEHLILLFFK